jgi:hypothetical protein
MKILTQRPLLIALGLAALMAATRSHHFGSALHLPDASLAVFLLAGFLIASPVLFGVLLVEAGLIDYLAITQFGVSDYCVTQAYWFLIPTYAVLWYAGRFYARVHQNSLRGLGQFAGLSFVGRVSQCYVQYLSGAAVYLVPAVLLYVLFVQRTRTLHSEAR